MKAIKVLAVLAVVSSVSAHAQYHNDIAPIKGARNDAKALIKSFQLQDLKLDTGAPEYTALYNNMFVPAIKEESDKLEKSLDAINQALSKDYSLIISLKGKPQTTALKETIKIAEGRLADAAEKMITEYYHKPIKSVVTLNGSFSKIVNKCLTVLCVNQVKEDFVKWTKLASGINKKLDLETTSMDKIDNFSNYTKKILQANTDKALEVGNVLAVSLTKEEYQDILAAEQKVIDDARIAKEKQDAEIARTSGASVAASAPVGDLYGCESIKEQGSQIKLCLNPYINKNGQKVALSSSSFSDEKHEAVCTSFGMTTGRKQIPMAWNAPSNNSDSFTVTRIVCLTAPAKTHQERIIIGSKMLLEDGSTLITNPKYSFEGNLGGSLVKGITKYGRENGDAICKFLGMNSAVNVNSWDYTSSNEGDFYIYENGTIAAYNQNQIWSKISCK